MRGNYQGVWVRNVRKLSGPPCPSQEQGQEDATGVGPDLGQLCRSLTTQHPGGGGPRVGAEGQTASPQAKSTRKEVTIVELLASLLFHPLKAVLTAFWG